MKELFLPIPRHFLSLTETQATEQLEIKFSVHRERAKNKWLGGSEGN